MSKIDELIENIKTVESPINFEEIKENAKIKNFLQKKQAEEIIKEVEEERRVKVWVIILAVIGVIAIGAAVGYCFYRKNKPDYLEDFEDDFEDASDDIFEDEE